MKELTEAESGKLIAYWNRKMGKAEIAHIREMVRELARTIFMSRVRGVRVSLVSSSLVFGKPIFGHKKVKAEIKLNLPSAFRTPRGDTIKGFDTITIVFSRNAGCFAVEKHREFDKREEELFSTLPKKEAMAAIDALDWDGEVVDMRGYTNGRIRGYRRRGFHPYEGRDHFRYSNNWDGLREGLRDCLYDIFRDVLHAEHYAMKTA